MSSPEEQSTANSRRIRSRIAQQAYRKRHKEKFDSSQKRAQDLQVAAQRACTVFTDLTSALIRSGVIPKDTNLSTEVLNAIKEFRHVAKVVDGENRQSGPGDVDQPPEDLDNPNAREAMPSDDHMDSAMTDVIQLDQDQEKGKNIIHIGSESTSTHHQLDQNAYPQGLQPPSDRILISPSYFALEFAIKGEPSSIGSRLLRTTLSSGYEALRGNFGYTTDLGFRIFGLTLSFRNRDDILSEFQWWLGPGQLLASRLKQARNYPGIPTSETYLSVEDVVVLLHDVGIVNSQDDILEFSNSSRFLHSPRANDGFNPLTEHESGQFNTDVSISQSYSTSRSESAWRRVPALQAFNFNSLMSNLSNEEDHKKETHTQAFPITQENRRRGIPMSILLQSLANISVCLSIGPGYPQQAVKSLLYAAISGIPMQ
ncbi:uncharacterized protein Triagg1_9986 [Trichoderma aggressivum f. europaeum]|uniref:BZIP domain-containing protein n=1 Tax=Trichoderma aggressivum f. europaeum TaxID=173218 RepID=A0AAE1I662_9HYPO|nr:hypothetical protein Triagg1_9986 [Trichoderma aggressivum f. europaeum]